MKFFVALLVAMSHQIAFISSKIVPRILEDFSVNIWAERHRSVHTEFSFVNTHLSNESPPLRQAATMEEMMGKRECPVSFDVHLCQDIHPVRKVCIYKDQVEDRFGLHAGLFEDGTMIDVEGLKIPPKDLYEIVTPVSGFLVNHVNSIVKGYLIKNNFYGSIRFYDKYRLYHVVYYVEPQSTVGWYNKNYQSGLTDNNGKELSNNAVIFEYVSHNAKASWIQCDKKAPPKPAVGQPQINATSTPKDSQLAEVLEMNETLIKKAPVMGQNSTHITVGVALETLKLGHPVKIRLPNVGQTLQGVVVDVSDDETTVSITSPPTGPQLSEVLSVDNALITKAPVNGQNASHITVGVEMDELKPGTPVKVKFPDGSTVQGVVESSGDGQTTISLIPPSETTKSGSPILAKVFTPDNWLITKAPVDEQNSTHLTLGVETPDLPIGRPVKVELPTGGPMINGLVVNSGNGQTTISLSPAPAGPQLAEVLSVDNSLITKAPVNGQNATHITVGIEMDELKPGTPVKVKLPDGSIVQGVVESSGDGQTTISLIPNRFPTNFTSPDRATTYRSSDDWEVFQNQTSPAVPSADGSTVYRSTDNGEVSNGQTSPAAQDDSTVYRSTDSADGTSEGSRTSEKKASTSESSTDYMSTDPRETHVVKTSPVTGDPGESNEIQTNTPSVTHKITSATQASHSDSDTKPPSVSQPIAVPTGPPFHSTEGFELARSTDRTPRTDSEYIHLVLRHSTERSPVTYLIPYHSTELTRNASEFFGNTTPDATTGVFSMYHSSTIGQTTIHQGEPIHSTELSPTSPRVSFAPSTEVTADEPTNERTMTPKILNSDEVLQQLSTEQVLIPLHSTEGSAGPQEPTKPPQDLTSRLEIAFQASTEHSPVISYIVHSTDPAENVIGTEAHKSPGVTLGTTLGTLPVDLLKHSTDVAVTFHSTDFTGVTKATIELGVHHSTEVPSQSFHSTNFASNVTGVHRTTSKEGNMVHSTAMSTPVVHSTSPSVITEYHEPPEPTLYPTNTDEGSNAQSVPMRSTERDRPPYHSTVGTMDEPEPPLPEMDASGERNSPSQKITSQGPNVDVSGHSTFLPKPPYHSTEVPQSGHRVRRELDLNQFFAEYPNHNDEEDVAMALSYLPGPVSNRLFDMKSDKIHVCQLCIWIQPHFADVFGLGGGVLHGIAEVVDLISFANQIFRSIDFNEDGIPENIGLSIKQLWLTDQISPAASVTRKKRSGLNLERSVQRNSSHGRQKREYVDDAFEEIMARLEHLYDEEEMFRARKRREDFDFQNYVYYEKYDGENDIQTQLDKSPQLREPKFQETLRQKLSGFSRAVKVIPPSRSLKTMEGLVKKKMTDCCAILGFIFHDMTPSISASNERGLCSSHNVGLVSGMFHEHKIMKYDVFRGIMHTLGHLFGAKHDSFAGIDCADQEVDEFINPFLLHPIQQSNVGVRPNSFRFSNCAKDSMTMFLSSNGAKCLQEGSEAAFCGNGVKEEGEVCDCGSLWQCHLRFPCCGEADTYMGCKIIADAKTACFRPTRW